MIQVRDKLINFGANWNLEFPGLGTHVPLCAACAPIMCFQQAK